MDAIECLQAVLGFFLTPFGNVAIMVVVLALIAYGVCRIERNQKAATSRDGRNIAKLGMARFSFSSRNSTITQKRFDAFYAQWSEDHLQLNNLQNDYDSIKDVFGSRLERIERELNIVE